MHDGEVQNGSGHGWRAAGARRAERSARWRAGGGSPVEGGSERRITHDAAPADVRHGGEANGAGDVTPPPHPPTPHI